jgi:CubicO group peptidase (beta-lactamase class C family)
VEAGMMRNLCHALFLTLLLLSAARSGEVLRSGRPDEVGMSAEALRGASAVVADAVARDDIRGAVVLVARHGRIVMHAAYGWQNVDEEQPMERDSLFRMASNTKPVIGTAVLMLEERGKLDIDDPIGRHLPAFDNADYRHVTIRNLLSHTSGLRIRTLFINPLLPADEGCILTSRLQSEVNRFASMPPEYEPGTTYSYNNAGYNTLGSLIEVCADQPLEEFLTDNIYDPLEMWETSNHPPAAELGRLCVVYARKTSESGEPVWKVRFEQETRMRVPFVRASGGMVSTAVDYANYCQMHLNGGEYDGRQVLRLESVRMAHTPQTGSVTRPMIDRHSGREFAYGLGWKIYPDGVYYHSGSEGTYAWIDPQRDLIGLLLTQSPGGDVPQEEFIARVTAACDG